MAKKMVTSEKSARRRVRKSRKLALERAKEFTFRGYTVEELMNMKLEELIPIMPARVRRSLKRGWNSEQMKAFEELSDPDVQVVKTHVRDMVILPSFIGKRVQLHNGKDFIEFEIKPEMIGHYLGEFALTRKEVKHSSPGVGATRSSKYVPLK
ncbi:MAG: 30S ribosomal protein S19 [Thermoplasmata archaeon]|nr:30S ribosomal protein S19 [Thermoplasmatales archaeon]